MQIAYASCTNLSKNALVKMQIWCSVYDLVIGCNENLRGSLDVQIWNIKHENAKSPKKNRI